MKTIILIAMLRTAGEGGSIQRDFADMDACWSFGVRLEQRFEQIVLSNGTHPTVLWTCVANE